MIAFSNCDSAIVNCVFNFIIFFSIFFFLFQRQQTLFSLVINDDRDENESDENKNKNKNENDENVESIATKSNKNVCRRVSFFHC